ncbi:MAG: helix-turn-helix domain-containing protein [Myxococcota bacterium]
MLRLYAPRPHERAAQWVQLIWEWDGYRSPAPTERILPHGVVEIAWNLSTPHRFNPDLDTTRIAHAALIGPRDAPYRICTSATSHLFGILFRPSAAGRFLQVGLHELFGSISPLNLFNRGAQLEARIGQARCPAERRQAALDFFETLPVTEDAHEASVLLSTWATEEGRAQSVKTLRCALGVSAPTFVHRVRAQLGLRPAQLRQVLMFREAVTLLARRTTPRTAVAHAVGYCDQAHLNRAFRRHAGLTPTQFRPVMPDHPFNLPEPA